MFPQAPSWARSLGQLAALALLLGCAAEGRTPAPGRAALRLLHTTDLHSHLSDFPALAHGARSLAAGDDEAEPLAGASGLPSDGGTRSRARLGGVARLATLLAEARAEAPDALYLDSGDLLEGAEEFLSGGGELELRALSALGLAATALGNHDLSGGAEAFAARVSAHARFPVLAANFRVERPVLARVLAPWALLDAGPLRVAVLGAGNRASLRQTAAPGNALGLVALETAEALQAALDLVAPLADVVVLLSHLGLDEDRALIGATSGLDVVLGGHTHRATEVPETHPDCAEPLRATRGCTPRSVLLVHSGAYGRELGVLDLVVERAAGGAPELGHEVAKFSWEMRAADESVEPERVTAAWLTAERARFPGGNPIIAYAEEALLPSTPPFARLVSCALGERVAGPALVQGSALRARLPSGPVTRDDVGRALPFPDGLVGATLRGAELTALLDALLGGAAGGLGATSGLAFRAERPCAEGPESRVVCAREVSAARACAGGGECFAPVGPDELVLLRAPGWLAGPDGSLALLRGRGAGDATRPLARLVAESFLGEPPCGAAFGASTARLCAVDGDCARVAPGLVCGCGERLDAACRILPGACATGRCVPSRCAEEVHEVALGEDHGLDGAPTCADALARCATLPCLTRDGASDEAAR